VPTEQSPVIVDRLGPESVLLSAGPRLFTMSSDEMRIPMIATGVTVHFVAENQPIPESDIVFAAALLQARKVAALTRASSEWMSDAIPEARPVVEQNHFREMGIKIDAAFFNGSGVAPELLGILNWSGVTKTPGTASLDDIAAAIGRVEAANAVPNAIFISPQNWSAIRVERDGGATGGYVLSPDASEAARARVFGVPVYVTPHVGTSIVVADMRSIAVGVRDRWLVLYDTYRYLEFDQVSIRTTSRWAIAPLHVAGVQIITTGVAAAEAETPNGTKDAAARAEAARKAEAEAARHTGRK
jgi:HK97 family phage major capsid protein